MYKTKIKQGQKIVIKDSRRSGITVVMEHGKEYTQDFLKRLHDAGFTHVVSKTKTKKQEDEKDNTSE